MTHKHYYVGGLFFLFFALSIFRSFLWLRLRTANLRHCCSPKRRRFAGESRTGDLSSDIRAFVFADWNRSDGSEFGRVKGSVLGGLASHRASKRTMPLYRLALARATTVTCEQHNMHSSLLSTNTCQSVGLIRLLACSVASVFICQVCAAMCMYYVSPTTIQRAEGFSIFDSTTRRWLRTTKATRMRQQAQTQNSGGIARPTTRTTKQRNRNRKPEESDSPAQRPTICEGPLRRTLSALQRSGRIPTRSLHVVIPSGFRSSGCRRIRLSGVRETDGRRDAAAGLENKRMRKQRPRSACQLR